VIDIPFEIDDDRSIKIYGVRYSMGFFQSVGAGPIGSVFQVMSRTEDGAVTIRAIYDYVPTQPQ
jgi:hypothetical protein